MAVVNEFGALDLSGAIPDALLQKGYALTSPRQVAALSGGPLASLQPLAASWNRLPRDSYLRDGGNYRSRRHSCFIHELGVGTVTQVARRAHWQPVDYNALHGGMERWFEPIEPAVAAAPAFSSLLRGLGDVFARLHNADRWYIEAHQFRIDTAAGIGRPTPEGAHRDGVDFVAVILIERVAVRGGETRVFEARGSAGVRFTMSEPWAALLLDDARVIHETTPIQPATDAPGIRDTLVVTYRASGFQEPAK